MEETMASNFKTPDVYTQEIDVSDILIPTGISNGGTVIRSKMGPINRPVLVTNDKEFVETFGEPVFTSGALSTESSLKKSNGTNFSTREAQQIPEYGYGSYAALEYLKESSSLYVVRGWSTSDKFADAWVSTTLTTSAYDSTNVSAYGGVTPSTSYSEFDKASAIQALDGATLSGALSIFANNPSVNGNSIAVTIEPFHAWADWRYAYDGYPVNSPLAASATVFTGEAELSAYPIGRYVFKLNVFVKDTLANWSDFIDKSGKVGAGMNSQLSGTQAAVSGTSPIVSCYRLNPVETFYGTLISMQDTQNNDLWIERAVNGNSKYIYVRTNAGTKFDEIANSAAIDYMQVAAKTDNGGIFIFTNHLIQLAGGASSQSTGIGSTAGWAGFENKETTPVNVLICPDWTAAVKTEVARVAAKRMNAVATLQVGDPTLTNRDDVRNSELYGYGGPSYGGLYSGFTKIYDKYTDKFVYIPNSIIGAELYARTDRLANPWDAPAGLNRGIVAALDQNKLWTKTDIGELYDRNINCVRFVPGTGFVMWGQKTAQMKKTALRDMNVRRCLIYIESNVESALNAFLFENNTDKTRLRVYNVVNEFLRSVYAGGGITSMQVICDDSNNPSSVIDKNQLNVDIYVAPARCIEFIQLSVVVTRTGVSMSEVLIQR